MDTTAADRAEVEPGAGKPAHWLDTAYAWFASRWPLFGEGWGDEPLLASADRGALFGPAPERATPSWGAPGRRGGLLVRDGTFPSPEGRLPDGVRTAHVRWISTAGPPARAVCLVLAGSREEGFRMRETIHLPLVRAGIDLVLLENPFSGLRRSAGQKSAAVRTVSDHLLLNLGMVQEARALLGWLGTTRYLHRAVAGYSMGGFMAALVAALTPEPLAVAALAAGTTPAPVFTQGLLSRSIDFHALGATVGGPDRARERLAALFGSADAVRLPAPVRPDTAVIVGCTADGYVSDANTHALHAHWPGSRERWLEAGHVSAVLTHRRALRQAVVDALARLDPAGATPP